ncbi:EAL domain-containing protein [Clostridium sp. DJ247]|uniref:sensor domain-containing protein n=1 Tax=Clostridium sp. DJ247 TaxID=2726188 RepID=UPI0016245CE5|nr:EAL domain-containing protein [Clostridium sp. DJ247]MBC2582252.1 EAL domain-containing protein [Clostridium sp. DJ247]
MKILNNNLPKSSFKKSRYLDLNNEEKYKLMLEVATNIMWQWDFQNNEFYILGDFKPITGFNNNEINSINAFTHKIIHPEHIDKVKLDLESHLTGKSIYFQSEFKIITKDSEVKWIFMRGKALKNSEGEPIWMAGSITDTTERKRTEEQATYMAYHDLLTDLPNNTYFSHKLNEAINESKINQSRGAVFFVDIDNFKTVNDTLGHNYGDLLLKIVAELLKLSVKDYGTVARFGGDEFLILIPNFDNEELLYDICEEIIDSFKNPFEVREMQVYCSVSVGIALYPDNGTNSTEILKNADTAMYNAKFKGKNNYSFYDKKIAESIMRKSKVENGLRTALNGNQLELYYQPQINIKTNKIKGLEVLLRWTSPELGVVSPDEFIPVAEETGLILKIGEWVLNTCCKQCKEWLDKGYVFDTFSINISPVQMQKKYFLDLINKVLLENNLKPEFLEIEITEGVLIKSIEENAELLKELISLGIKISIDDFGKGYSSLNYLTVLPINTLKIDKSFVDNINNDVKQRSIVECIIELAKKLKYDVIAEGVETEEQKKLLDVIGCFYVQGYYYSKPLCKSKVEKILTKNKPI